MEVKDVFKKGAVFYDSGSGNTEKTAKAIAEGMRSSLLNVAGKDGGEFFTSPDSY
jgi:flavodoxin